MADISKAKANLGWVPKISFSELVQIMVDADMEFIGLAPIGEGKKVAAEKGIHWTKNRITMG